MEHTIQTILEDYRSRATDPSQPFFRQVYNLHTQFPNDLEFGSSVRKLIFMIDEKLREEARSDSNFQFEELMKKYTNDGKI